MEIHFLKIDKTIRENSKQIFEEGGEKAEEKENGQRKVGKDDEEGEVRGAEGKMDGRGGGGEILAAASPTIK